MESSMAPRLSVIVPVYNEVKTVDTVLERLTQVPYRHPDQQVIVVDDGSTDGTAERLAKWQGRSGLHLFRHAANRGKGRRSAPGWNTPPGS